MMRSRLTAFGLGTGLCLLAGSYAPAALSDDAPAMATAERPNIVFIMADDHAYQAISAYGSQLVSTPNIDRIARDGVRFDRALVQNSLCAPARAALLTGKMSHINGVLTQLEPLDGKQPTLQSRLHAAGYTTAIFGKWHLQNEPTGFDQWEIFSDLFQQGQYYNPHFLTAKGEIQRQGYATEIVANRSIEWMDKERDKSKPFMLLVWQKAPHRPWDPNLDKLSDFEDQKIPEPATLYDDYAGRADPAREQHMEIGKDLGPRDLKALPPKDMTPEQLAAWNKVIVPQVTADSEASAQAKGRSLTALRYQRFIKNYIRTVETVDDTVGEILDYLDKSGLSKNTIVIYSSDQGFYLGEHGWFDKRWMYEQSLRTPLLIRWPGIAKPGSDVKQIVSQLDVTPTLLEAAQAPITPDLQGKSLVPLLEGKVPADWRKSFYYHYYECPSEHQVACHIGVATDRYKLIYYYQSNQNVWELFDLQRDPNEMKSVYDDPAYAEVQKNLKAELERLRVQYKDTEDLNSWNNWRHQMTYWLINKIVGILGLRDRMM